MILRHYFTTLRIQRYEYITAGMVVGAVVIAILYYTRTCDIPRINTIHLVSQRGNTNATMYHTHQPSIACPTRIVWYAPEQVIALIHDPIPLDTIVAILSKDIDALVMRIGDTLYKGVPHAPLSSAWDMTRLDVCTQYNVVAYTPQGIFFVPCNNYSAVDYYDFHTQRTIRVATFAPQEQPHFLSVKNDTLVVMTHSPHTTQRPFQAFWFELRDVQSLLYQSDR